MNGPSEKVVPFPLPISTAAITNKFRHLGIPSVNGQLLIKRQLATFEMEEKAFYSRKEIKKYITGNESGLKRERPSKPSHKTPSPTCPKLDVPTICAKRFGSRRNAQNLSNFVFKLMLRRPVGSLNAERQRIISRILQPLISGDAPNFKDPTFYGPSSISLEENLSSILIRLYVISPLRELVSHSFMLRTFKKNGTAIVRKVSRGLLA